MDLLKRLITLVVISIFSIVITCHANPPETGSFKIPQIVITNKDALKIVFDATKFAKKNGCNPAEYNIYFNLIRDLPKEFFYHGDVDNGKTN